MERAILRPTPSAGRPQKGLPWDTDWESSSLAIGLILALAVQDSIDAIDLTLIGWILAGCGVLVIVLAASANRSRAPSTVTTTHADGTQTTTEKRTRRPAAHRLT